MANHGKTRPTATGTFQPPPPGAPQEVSAPLSDAAVQQMAALAAEREKVLPPFNPQPSIPPAASPAASAADVGADAPVTADAPPAPAAPPFETEVEFGKSPLQYTEGVKPDPLLAVDYKRPAESDTDSPSRGIPRPVADPGKQITGGFGSLGEAQYFALDGTELRAVVEKIAAELIQRLQTDLRFSIAITYPRVSAKLQLVISGYAEDAGFTVEAVASDERTPVEVAKERADQVVFVLEEFRREFDDAGQPENPPDRMRDELGLQKPRKQFIGNGPSRMMVDVPNRIGDAF